MVELGIGRNMVRSIRFWAIAFGIYDTTNGSPQRSEFADWLLDRDTGADPYLEDIESLWLLHWRLTATADLAAWNLIFFETPEVEIYRRFFIERLQRRAAMLEKRVKASTIKQHAEIFLNTYVLKSHANDGAAEEGLGCPLQELGLMRYVTGQGTDTLIQLRRGPWAHLSPVAFLRILSDYWWLRSPRETTVSLRALLLDYASPGVVLRLDELSLLHHIRQAQAEYGELFDLTESVDRSVVTLKVDSVEQLKQAIGYC